MNDIFLNYSSLAILCVMSVFVLWGDIKNKKIKNKWIVGSFVAWALLLLFAFIVGAVSLNYLIQVSINTFISFLVGFIIWRSGFWPAGDGKLFIIFSFLLPLHCYWRTYLPHFPSFVLLINSFFVFLVFLTLKSIFYFMRSFFILVRNENFWQGYWKSHWNHLRMKSATIRRDKDMLRKLFLKISIKIGVYLFFSIFLSSKRIHFEVFYFLFFIALDFLLNFYIRNQARKRIKVSNLTIGMNLSDETVLALRKDADLFEKIGVLRSDGLEECQIDLIKQYWQRHRIEELYIFQTMPFAPWIVLGMLLTILLNGNLLQMALRSWR